MAKYVITTVLLTILAMEIINLFTPISVRSHGNGNKFTSSHHQRHRGIELHHNTSQTQRNRRNNIHHQDNRGHTHHPPDNRAVDEVQTKQSTEVRHIRHSYNHHGLRNKPNLWRHLIVGDVSSFAGSNHDISSNHRIYSNEDVMRNDTNGLRMDLRHKEDFNADNNVGSYEESVMVINNAKRNSNSGPLRCPKCESNQRKVETVTEEELTHLRIEFVKQQILEKLRLKDKPNVSAVGLPKPIYEGTTIQHDDEETKNKDLDDYYARTSKKFIFLEREKVECNRLGPEPSICFSFKIDDADVDGFDVNTAVLWIFKNKLPTNSINRETILKQHIIVVSEVEQGINSIYLPKVKPIAIQSVDVQDGWVKIDIEWPIKRWFGNHDLSHLIHIFCESCEIDTMDGLISDDKDYRPFIMIDTQNRRRVSRQKRSINCTEGVTECCREKLYISFDEIGWGNWIIQPRGYDAYFCRGSCGSIASVTQSTSHHSTFLQKVSTHRKSSGKKALELTPCCTAKQFSSLQLFFIDSNNTATLKTFPNMVIESCGCR